MEIKFNKFIVDNKEYNMTITSKDITAISTNDNEFFKKLISLKYPLKGEIIINGRKVTDDNLNTYQRQISIVNSYKLIPFVKTVLDYMNYVITSKNLKIKNPNKKIIDSLKIVGLDEKYLLREMYTLSSSEKELIQIAVALLSNPEILILTDQFLKLDLINQKKIYMVLIRLKEQYHKAIIILSDNANILYKYCTKGIIIKNGKILVEGDIKDVYCKVEMLRKSKFDIPEIVEFTHKAKKLKKVKIDYHKDIRDIIKDIYKHV